MPVTPAFGPNELGRTGLKHFGGTLYEEFLVQLQGQRGVLTYTEMSQNSPVIGAMLFAVEALLRSVEWEVEPVSEASEHMEAAEFVEENMYDMSSTWEDFISEVLTMLIYGWSYFEVVYKPRKRPLSQYDDGKVGWANFSPRAQETLYRWEIDEFGQILGMWQYPIPSTPASFRSNSTIFLPMAKSLLFRTTSRKNSPEGRSVLRSAYRPWYLAKRLEEIEAIGVERNLAGLPVMWVPLELLNAEKTAEQQATFDYMRDIVTRTKRDEQEGLLLPLVYDEDYRQPLYKFELLNAQGRQSFDTGGIIQRYMQEMAMTIMADFILLGHESVGSFALSSDKTELFAVALGAWLDSIEETINRYAVRPLLEVNAFDIEDGYPHIVHGDIEKPDLTQLGAYVRELSAAGVPLFPDIELENHLRQAASWPLADPEEREKIMQQQMEMARMQMEANAAPGGKPGEEPASDEQKPKPKKPTVSGTKGDDDDV